MKLLCTSGENIGTLLPDDASPQAIEGYSYGGQSFDPPQTALSQTANRWRIEVRPGAPRTDDTFLHVLSTGSPEPATLLSEGDSIGARVGRTEVLFAPGLGGVLRIGESSYELEGEVQTGPFE